MEIQGVQTCWWCNRRRSYEFTPTALPESGYTFSCYAPSAGGPQAILVWRSCVPGVQRLLT